MADLLVEYLGPGGSVTVPNADGGWDSYPAGMPLPMSEELFATVITEQAEHAWVVHPAADEAPAKKAAAAAPKTESTAAAPEGAMPAA